MLCVCVWKYKLCLEKLRERWGSCKEESSKQRNKIHSSASTSLSHSLTSCLASLHPEISSLILLLLLLHLLLLLLLFPLPTPYSSTLTSPPSPAPPPPPPPSHFPPRPPPQISSVPPLDTSKPSQSGFISRPSKVLRPSDVELSHHLWIEYIFFQFCDHLTSVRLSLICFVVVSVF